MSGPSQLSITCHDPAALPANRRRRRLLLLGAAAWLAGCSGVKPRIEAPSAASVADDSARQEVVFFSLALLDTGYRFGGKNPEAGVDCSGMVTYVYRNAVGRALTGSAADIAKLGRALDRADLAPADLVFFNTRGGRYSHVGIYIGEGRFIHAPSSRGRVRIEAMDNVYFGPRFTAARTYFG